MNTQNTQLRVTLPLQLQAYLQTKADKYGLSLSAYVRNLILNDVQDVEYPVYTASEATEKSYKAALEQKDSAVTMEDFFDESI